MRATKGMTLNTGALYSVSQALKGREALGPAKVFSVFLHSQ